MKLSNKCNYALKVILDLSHHFGHHRVHIADLAKRQRIPRKYLEQILLQLKKGVLVQSKKGPNGGYALARPPSEIRVGDVIRLVERSRFSLFNNEPESFREKTGANRNGFYGVFAEVEAAIFSVIDAIDFNEILKREAEILAKENQSLYFDI